MKTFKYKKIALVSLVALLAGCGGSDQTITLDPVAGTSDQVAQTQGSVVMDFTTSDIPFPHDALFSGSEDGTLNIPVEDAADVSDPTVALNALDGFSTTSPITFSLTKAMDTTDANANTIADVLELGVKVFKTTSDPATKAVLSVDAQLIPGVDYFPMAVDAQTVAIMPLKPLSAKTTYLMVVSDSLKDEDGESLTKGIIYENLSGTEVLTGSLEGLEPLRQLTLAQLTAVSDLIPVDESIVSSWTFTTQSTSDVLDTLKANVANDSIAMADTSLKTDAVGGSGKAHIYSGTITVPYYLTSPSETNPIAPLNTFWSGVGGSLLTQFNPSPVKTADVTIPVLMTKPAEGTTGLTKPDAGWPVVIFQHGVTQNRGNVFAIADALAQAGYASIAIDMPLHGISADDALASFRIDGVSERQFDVDYVTQDEEGSITDAAPDGVVDSSGRHYINLSSLLTLRDNVRQSVSDLMHLKASLPSLANTVGTNIIDPTKVAFVGHSLGGIVGGVFTDILDNELESAVFAMTGTQASYLLAGSPEFGPEIVAGLAEQGIEAGSADFNKFLLAAQTTMDSVDPVNYISAIMTASLMIEVVGIDTASQDQVVPNSVATAPLAGTEPWIALQQMSALTDTGSVTDGKGVLRFTSGDHNSILSPAADVTATVTMQEAMASFVATQGAAISVSDNSTIKQD
ncbi:MAG: Ig-like domain-containing protein [Pseudomonadota bacterium]|nr:Ig-like domain-containing protein [Pseudomonadota bacterium]